MTWMFSAEEWLVDFTSSPRGRPLGDRPLDALDQRVLEALPWVAREAPPQLVMPSIVPKRSTIPSLVAEERAPTAPTRERRTPPLGVAMPLSSDGIEIQLHAPQAAEPAPATGLGVFIPTLTRGAGVAPPPSAGAPEPRLEIGLPLDDDDDLFLSERFASPASAEPEPVVETVPVVSARPAAPLPVSDVYDEVEDDDASGPAEAAEVEAEDAEAVEAEEVEVEDEAEVEAEAEDEAEDVASSTPEPLRAPEPPRAVEPPRAPPRAAPAPPPRAAPAPPPRAAPSPPREKRPERRRGWYDEVFADHYPSITPRDADVSAELDVEFMIKAAKIGPDDSILDVGCGDGRHLFAFANKGFSELTGLDASLSQLLVASRRNESTGAGLTFLHGDMRELPTDRSYDAVACLGMTFGFFEDEPNRFVLQDMAERLRPGGRLILQVMNRDHLMSIVPCRSWWQGRGCLVLDVAEMNFFANRLRVHRTIVFEDGRQFEHHIFIRLYTVNELGKMVSSLGLRILDVSGSRDTPGRFFGAASPDIWICAQRPER